MKTGEVFNPWGLFRGVFIPLALLKHPQLSPAAKLCYGRLVLFAGEDGRCYPSLRKLAEELGVTKACAKRYVRELRDAELIVTSARQTDHGDADTNDVRFLWHPMFEGEPLKDQPGVSAEVNRGGAKNEPTGRVIFDPRGGVKNVPLKDSIVKDSVEEKHHQQKRAGDDATDAHFRDFWEKYPRKVGRGAAEKAFRHAVKDEATWDVVRSAIERQAPAMLQREPQYRPHPATWLNQRRWEDEPEQPTLALQRAGPQADRYAAHSRKVDEIFRMLMAERMAR